MKLGVALPIVDIGGEPDAIREFAQAAEAIGYHGLAAPDHVLGVNVASRPGWTQGRARSTDLYHDPFVLFGFLAGVTKIADFSTQVLILPQRQTALVAKQAACLDVLCGGRFRLGIGVGWNEVEFVGLNEDFHNRGRRSEEQVEVMQALWAEPHIAFKGRWHTIPDAGINPRPATGKSAAVVWRPCRSDVAPGRQIWRRLDAARLRTRRRGARRLRPAAPDGGGSRPRPGDDRLGYARLGGRRRGEMARRRALLEILRRHAPDARELLRERPPAPHRRPYARPITSRRCGAIGRRWRICCSAERPLQTTSDRGRPRLRAPQSACTHAHEPPSATRYLLTLGL